MTTSDSSPRRAFVWVWLPGASDPVVACAVLADGAELVFAYGKSYLARRDAISLQPPTTERSAGLPLIAGTQRPPEGLDAHGA